MENGKITGKVWDWILDYAGERGNESPVMRCKYFPPGNVSVSCSETRAAGKLGENIPMKIPQSGNAAHE